ncbi:hypothetical protein BOVAC1_1579 [Bacteroides ovatus]|nr:hypothetical protein BOVAC1_1579 [Bacteroides ovatus]CAG9876258.1 hypothetical protein BOVA115_589 [Bacteroides ovatus]CAG9883698.1 hypothetical protein BOVA711_609 [Bacteroides ovatus]CAG9905930.1 hypothetical protein BOVAB4_496 [Bacteroides ovatus]CAG9906805.1 hypothetical protein BOVA172_1414 [Bacteroides ovatus]
MITGNYSLKLLIVNFIGVYVIPLVHCFLLIPGYNIGI